MLVVIALGGNALLRRGEPPEADTQRRNIRRAAAAVAEVVRVHRVVLTHGNGPQVGLLARQSRDPLDVLDAETEGMIGYLLEQELGRFVPPERLATLLTQVVVDPHDPAFDAPAKPIGLAGDRRLVPSPEPKRIVGLDVIRLLMDAGVTVTCGGGGGIPVVPRAEGGYTGVEAVIDKDLFSSLLARSIGADALLLLTDVDAVYRDWGTSDAAPVAVGDVDELRRLPLPPGSMGPKVEAACRFVEAGGTVAAIGALGAAAALLDGTSGTQVRAVDATSTRAAKPGSF